MVEEAETQVYVLTTTIVDVLKAETAVTEAMVAMAYHGKTVKTIIIELLQMAAMAATVEKDFTAATVVLAATVEMVQKARTLR